MCVEGKPEIFVKGPIEFSQIYLAAQKDSGLTIPIEVSQFINSYYQQREAEAKKHGGIFFNGQTFRLTNYKFEDKQLHLSLAKIDFKTLIGLRDLPPELKPISPVANGLAVGAILQDASGNYIFGKKLKNWNSEIIQKYKLIGGILPYQKKLPNSKYLLDHLLIELEEETGIRIEVADLTLTPKVLGLVKGRYFGAVICLINLKLNLEFSQMQGIFFSRKDPELDEIVQVLPENLAAFCQQNGYKVLIPELVNG